MRKGIKWSPATAPDETALLWFMGQIKTCMAAAGFAIFNETATGFEAIGAGGAPGDAGDDIPHWAFFINDEYPLDALRAVAVFGANKTAPAAMVSDTYIVSIAKFGSFAAPGAVYFAADGVTGWWWTIPVSAEGEITEAAQRTSAGVVAPRYPIDLHQGIAARYGIWNGDGWLNLPRAMYNGTMTSNQLTELTSAIGNLDLNIGNRQGSAIPRMVVPIWPIPRPQPVAIFRELEGFMVATDGYANFEEAAPGLRVFNHTYSSNIKVAVPCPPAFDVVTP